MSSFLYIFMFSPYLDLVEELPFHLSCCVILVVLVLHTSLSSVRIVVIDSYELGDFFLAVFSFFFPHVSILQNRAVVVGVICLVFVFPLCMMKSLYFILLVMPSCGFVEVCFHGLYHFHSRNSWGCLRAVHH